MPHWDTVDPLRYQLRKKNARAIRWDAVNSVRSQFINGVGKTYVLYKRALDHGYLAFPPFNSTATHVFRRKPERPPLPF